MTTSETILGALSAFAPLTAIVGQRVRSDIGKETDTYPLVVFKRVAIEPTFGLNNELLVQRDTFQVESWAVTRVGALDLSEQVMLALVAAGLPPSIGDSDALDPVEGAFVAVWNVDVWFDPSA